MVPYRSAYRIYSMQVHHQKSSVLFANWLLKYLTILMEWEKKSSSTCWTQCVRPTKCTSLYTYLISYKLLSTVSGMCCFHLPARIAFLRFSENSHTQMCYIRSGVCGWAAKSQRDFKIDELFCGKNFQSQPRLSFNLFHFAIAFNQHATKLMNIVCVEVI